MTLTKSYSAVRLSVCIGSATFRPYLTIGLAWANLYANKKKLQPIELVGFCRTPVNILTYSAVDYIFISTLPND